MKNYIFLLIGCILLCVNLFYIGLLKDNGKNTKELFVKHRPTLKMVFESSRNMGKVIHADFKREASLYKEFITDRNIADKSRSFLPLILIQLMLSCFALFPIKIDFTRKLVLFPFHFILCLIGFFPIVAYAFGSDTIFLGSIIASGIILLNYLAAYFFTK